MNEHELLGRALRVLIQYQDLESCSIFLLHEGKLVCAVGRSWADHMYTYESCPESSPYVFRLGEGVVGQAAQEQVLIHSRDCALDERCLPLETKTVPGSLISVPILTDGQVLGVLNVSHPYPDFFHPWHNHMLWIFCNTLGQMLTHYRLLSRMEEAVNERTRQLKKALQEAQELKLRYEQLSIVDDLTRLHNRRFFFPEANAELSRAIRNRESFGLMLIDLDHFKHINDTYGHSVGDEVLKEVAVALSCQTRDGDILARFGGEEFVMALPTTSQAGAKLLAERICSAIGRLQWQAQGKIIKITLSIGISCFSPSPFAPQEKGEVLPKAALDTLLKEADGALYYGKTHGRNQVRVYQELPEGFNLV